MPVNHYFQGGQGIGNQAEKSLYEDIIVEGLKIYGHDVYYLPRTLVNKDLILGEDTSSRFEQAYMVEMYFETTEGFAGQRELVSKFGLEIREDTTFVVSKRSWEAQVNTPGSLIVSGRPNEGDIIYFPLMNSFFEILFVEDQEPFFQLGNLPVYKLRVTRWQYNSEQLDTGDSNIDENEDKFSLNTLIYRVTLEEGDGSFLLEEETDAGQPQFFLSEDFAPVNIQTQSNYAENLDLDTAAGFDSATLTDDILDFEEKNPFGEIN